MGNTMEKERKAYSLKSSVNNNAEAADTDTSPRWLAPLFTCLLLLVCLLGAAKLARQPVLGHSPYDSYTRQAMAWLSGTTYLDVSPESVSYLELAEYNGRLYVSFPPVPSVAELPLALLFGSKTPDRALVYLYFLGGAALLALTFRRKNALAPSVLYALLATAASNLLPMAVFGGVWHEAQALCFLFSALSVFLITGAKPISWHFALFSAALAVGCRPFVLLFFPVLFYELWQNLRKANPALNIEEITKKGLPYLALPALVGLLLAGYNMARFGNPLEFGHNYLPEFTRHPEEGQFSLQYLGNNLANAFTVPALNVQVTGVFPFIQFGQPLAQFNLFTANAFYLFNPIVLCFFVAAVLSVLFGGFKKLWISLVCLALFVVGTCLHKTLGGMQFGARYFLDCVPFLCLPLAKRGVRLNPAATLLLLFGIALNLYGVTLLWP